jgi:hypothetical protein
MLALELEDFLISNQNTTALFYKLIIFIGNPEGVMSVAIIYLAFRASSYSEIIPRQLSPLGREIFSI